MTQTRNASRLEMRAATLFQPWASLVVYGPKRIENRPRKPWERLVGGIIGIHAGRQMARRGLPYARRHGLPAPWPQCALLGFARIAGTVDHSDDEFFLGPIGIQLSDVVAYPTPMPMKGAQGYWSVFDRLTADQREHLDERMAIRCEHGEMTEELASWWALYDVLKAGGRQ